MEQLFGNFFEQQDGKEYLEIHFSPTSTPLQTRWRNNGLSADFLAEYWSTFFPAHDNLSKKKQIEIKGTINYIANELLENMMKFTYQPHDYPVDLELYLYGDKFRFYTCNSVDPSSVQDFQDYIQELLTQDTAEMYDRQIEANAANDGEQSRLGLLTMINDYGASLAWKFSPSPLNPDIAMVTTMVQIDL